MSRAEKKQARIKREAEWEVQMSEAVLKYMDESDKSVYSFAELMEAAGKQSMRISALLPPQEKGRVLIVFERYVINLEIWWKEKTDDE